LDVGLSEEQKEKFLCTTIISGCTNKDWAIDLYSNVNNLKAIVLLRTSGKYEGGGFMITLNDSRQGDLLCYERAVGNSFRPTAGAYCRKLFNGTYLANSANGRIYSLP
ncbi:MAG: hypothetical protein MJ053_03740, partial [Elusimicrobiaceae bacterium]|nr:hypothetical protein [Elusimicrobiaceae bacterium]